MGFYHIGGRSSGSINFSLLIIRGISTKPRHTSLQSGFKVFHVFSAHFPRLCRQTLTHKDKFRQLRRLEFFELLHNVKELFCKLASLTLSKTQAKVTDPKLFLSNLVKVNLTASIVKIFCFLIILCDRLLLF